MASSNPGNKNVPAGGANHAAGDARSSILDMTEHDPTWRRAYEIAQGRLRVPTAARQIIRLSWQGAAEPREFVRMLSFSRLNIPCLLDAANLLREQEATGAGLILKALQNLGIRFSAVILGINHCCSSALERKPQPLWRKLFQEMMTWAEIGYRIGARAPSLGLEAGTLMGFSRYAGHILLLADDPISFRKWTGLSRPEGEAAVKLFGCEPYQVSALALQQLGFGHEVAIGAALGNAKSNLKYLRVDERTLFWKAAIHWIEALKEGRNYPASLEIRQLFPELSPPKDSSIKNPILDAVYAEVARVRAEGSSWTWHLPKPGYDQTAESMGLPQ